MGDVYLYTLLFFILAGYVAILIDSVFGNGRLRLIEISFPITLIGSWGLYGYKLVFPIVFWIGGKGPFYCHRV
ncbi:hypothetical protein [Peribacillus muralis]|uniref:hypothetical protein n=1 Tax=Peribacillus muralis TaxID=264697 RepID=UPI00070CF2F4|nr:hypothetical protein [Peribacillus muralis]